MRRPPLGTPGFPARALVAPLASLALASLTLATGGCGQLPVQTTETESPIFGGTPDTTHSAVMALIDQISMTNSSACSGTTIALSGASGIFLTAGHCVVANDGMGHVTTPIKLADPGNLYIVPGPDWQTSVGAGLYYGVGQVAVHPQYDGSVDSPFDVALVRYLGAVPAQPVIPVLAATDDTLAVGSTVTIVGFGKTETNASNSQRFEVDRLIQSITTNQFIYDQTDGKGACQGDSGGPALFQTAAGPRVAGVTSFGDPDCTKVGASVRVSPVYASFIQSFISGAPAKLSCDDCALATVGPGNACVNQSIACAATTSACGKFLTCADACTSSACVTQCQRNNPTGATAYNDILSCQCAKCGASCSTSTACGGSGSTGAAGGTGTTGTAGTSGTTGTAGASGDTGAAGTSGANLACQDFTDARPLCQDCMQTTCCAQAIACGSDETCTACLVQASSSACRLNAAYAKMVECLAGCPGAPCSASAAAAGTGGVTGQTTTGGSSGGCDVGGGTGGDVGLAAALALLYALAIARSSTRARARG